MKYLQKLATENKKLALTFVAFVALGAAMMLLGGMLPQPYDEAIPTFTADFFAEEDEPREKFLYERALEERLAYFLSLVDGAGTVTVMVSPLTGRETIFAVDRTENTTQTSEADSEGGTRETLQSQFSEETIILENRMGTIEPLILREIEPRVAGIVIVATGGECPHVREALTRAARAVLGLEPHMIQVLTKREP
jgi:stage III sporulation protein AG